MLQKGEGLESAKPASKNDDGVGVLSVVGFDDFGQLGVCFTII